MKNRQANEGNWQARGQMFAVGQAVALVNGSPTDEGRVIAVWPAIGMVDVQFPHTNYRLPVEDLQIINPANDTYITPMHETVPGGAGSAAMVSQGKPQNQDLIQGFDPPVQLVEDVGDIGMMASRVARAHIKKALYWNGKDRKYRSTRVEGATGHYGCPKGSCDGTLKPAVYKRQDSASVKLLGCPKCMFLIRKQDIIDGAECDVEEEAI